MSETIEKMPVAQPAPTPKAIAFVQNYISPLNALYIFPLTIAALLDILSPFGPLLIGAAVLTGLVFGVMWWRQTKLKKEHKLPFKKTTLVFALVSFLIFSASALANFNHNKGLLANWVPKIKTWQDAYLVSIKEDTENIKKQTTENGQKIDKTNIMLAQMLDSLRPQLEKPLVEQIKGYKTLPENQKNALLLFTAKVGVNGIKRYKGLIKATNLYAENKTPENAKAVAEHLNYIVRVNGKDIEDTKTKKLLMSLFLDPKTYDYLMGTGEIPEDKTLLAELNINTALPVGQQLDDPLGDFINSMNASGTPVTQQVVVPSSENINYNPNPIKSYKPSSSGSKTHLPMGYMG